MDKDLDTYCIEEYLSWKHCASCSEMLSQAPEEPAEVHLRLPHGWLDEDLSPQSDDGCFSEEEILEILRRASS